MTLEKQPFRPAKDQESTRIGWQSKSIGMVIHSNYHQAIAPDDGAVHYTAFVTRDKGGLYHQHTSHKIGRDQIALRQNPGTVLVSGRRRCRAMASIGWTLERQRHGIELNSPCDPIEDRRNVFDQVCGKFLGSIGSSECQG